jgi:hypothetical protein
LKERRERNRVEEKGRKVRKRMAIKMKGIGTEEIGDRKDESGTGGRIEQAGG